MKTVTVAPAGGPAYPVLIGDDSWRAAAQYAAETNAVITTANVEKLYGEKLLHELQPSGKSCFVLSIADGETGKNMDSLQQLLDGMLAQQMGRDGCVFSLGGGVVGDVAGFAAAVYMRGIALVHIPTTLLAQVDAAIGGKTGVNHRRGKNLIGAFHQPRAVLIDPAVLGSLPQREYCAGLAEVVKYGLLADADFFDYVEDNACALLNRDAAALEHTISASVRIKAKIVQEDEKENNGRRALLNLGHTFAHAAETVCGYGAWLHGEAVAFGLVAAARLSQRICRFDAAESERIIRLLDRLNLPVHLPAQGAPASLLKAMNLDKKNQAGSKRFILMQKIGSAFITDVNDASVLNTLEQMQ